jgi:photosystem II stability/assembly factor-like uncharacterized protein
MLWLSIHQLIPFFMKSLSLKFTFVFILFLSPYIQAQPDLTDYDKNSADYWLVKMSDPNQNYYDLVNEFNSFWEGKTLDKNSGYKQFRRWQFEALPFVLPDGSFKSANHDFDEFQKFKDQNPGDEIVGTWTPVGPTVFPQQYYGNQCPGLGRISALAFHPTDEDILFAGAPLGGLWKSTDGGDNWVNWHTDNINTMGVSDIVIDYTNADIIYIGTGDRDGWMSWGLGVYKSTDGGYTWTQKTEGMGNKIISKLLMYPDNHNYLLAAAENGIYFSANGGESWTKVHSTSNAVRDLVFKPGNPNYIYATAGGTLYRSTNYGAVWNSIMTTDAHRMVIAVTPDNPDKFYVMATKNSKFTALYFSNDSGSSLYQYNSTGLSIEGQGGYNLDLAVDPNNENILYCGMINVFKSTDGGYSWTMIANAGQIHADQHVFEFSPHTDDYLFIGNDGGVYKIWVGGGNHTVTTISDGLMISEVYRLGTSATNPDLMICGMQDCGTYVTSSIPWLHREGGDGMNCEIDYSDPNIMYASSQNGNISRSVDGGNSFQGIAADGVNGINQSGDWLSAFVLDQFDHSIMFAGFKDVWRSNNVNTMIPGNITWTNISAGQLSGQDIMLIEQSPVDGNYVFVADAGGNRFFMTTNAYSATPTWTELEKPYSHNISRIEAHPTNSDIVYFAIVDVISRYEISTNTWTNLTGNLPLVTKLCLVYQKNSNEGLYVGTTTGIFYKDAEMSDWVVYKSDLPTTNIFDMEINYDTDPPQLFAATFGRGIWKTDVYPSVKPNLVTSGISSQVSGTLVEMIVGYQNQSAIASAEAFKIGYYLSVNNIIGPGDYQIGEENRPEAAPMLIGQGHLQATDAALVSPEIPSGTYYMGTYLDYENVVNELSETDNRITASQQVTIPAAPAAPTNIQATDGTITNCINISWTTPAGGPYYYRVFRNTSNNPAGAVNVSGSEFIGTTSFNDYSAPRGLDIYYWVKASAYTQGYRSSDYSVSNAGWYPVLAPSNVQATDGQFSIRVTVTWSPSVNATHFRVFRSTINNPSLSTNISGINWITTEYFHDLTAVAGTTYYYWLKAACSASGARASDYSTGNSGWVAFASAPDAIASDGTYTDKVSVTWNTVSGATYYKVFRNTVNNPETSSAMTVWQLSTTYDDVSSVAGTNYYYWIKASNDMVGTLQTGYGLGDSGWKNLNPPTGLTATDGTLIEQTAVAWTAASGASRYKVYRHTQANFANATAISYWINTLSYSDHTSVPGLNHYYWIVAAGDTTLGQSQPTVSESGWCLLNEPDVTASKGLYNDHVHVNWDAVNGGIAYRVYRSPISSSVAEPITNWSTTLNFEYDDYTTVQGEQYWYYVKAAKNFYGLRESDFGEDIGFADECGNMIDDLAFRSVFLHGATLDITQKITNEGPYDLLNQGQIAFGLEDSAPYGTPSFIIAYVDIPPLAIGQSYMVDISVDLNTVLGGPVPLGTWYVSCYTSYDFANCDANADDDYIVWEELPFTYTDAMYGTYTIGPVSGDYYSIDKALLALQERGISDNVIFNLEPTTFVEQNTIPAIEGASRQHFIVFQSDPSKGDTAIITCAPSPTENYTIRFNNASNIILRNLKLTTSGFTNFESNYGRVIDINGACSDISIKDNLIVGYTDTYLYNDDNSVIYSRNSPSSNIEISGNIILNGVWGILMEGSNLGSGPLTSVLINKNHIEGFNYWGIEMKYLDNPVITGNTIISLESDISFTGGISVEFTRNSFDISGNQLIMSPTYLTVYGIQLGEINLVQSNVGYIRNNIIVIHGDETNNYALYIYKMDKSRIYNNSIHIYGTPGEYSACASFEAGDDPVWGYDNEFKCNILSNEADGYCLTYGDDAYNHQMFASSDYNDFFASGPDLFFFKYSYGIQTLNQWYNETGFDQHSFNYDPVFISDIDLHSNSEQLDGMGYPLVAVQEDIDGDPRDPVHPDIGADEYSYVAPIIKLEAHVYLEGPFFESGMKCYLKENGLLPVNQPYNTAPWNYEGSEINTFTSQNVVDWVLVELRDATSAANATTGTRIARQAALLKSDGSIVGTDGSSLLQFNNSIIHQLFVVIWHRNHIEIMSAGPVPKLGELYYYDFTTDVSKAYGSGIGYKDWGAGVAVMVAGDGNSDGIIDFTDKQDFWENQTGMKGYQSADFNLNTQVDNTDKNQYWDPNYDEGFTSQVPD